MGTVFISNYLQNKKNILEFGQYPDMLIPKVQTPSFEARFKIEITLVASS